MNVTPHVAQNEKTARGAAPGAAPCISALRAPRGLPHQPAQAQPNVSSIALEQPVWTNRSVHVSIQIPKPEQQHYSHQNHTDQSRHPKAFANGELFHHLLSFCLLSANSCAWRGWAK